MKLSIVTLRLRIMKLGKVALGHSTIELSVVIIIVDVLNVVALKRVRVRGAYLFAEVIKSLLDPMS
jgi:hypothetical protein